MMDTVFLFLMAFIGALLGHFGVFLAVAWHEEEPVFTKWGEIRNRIKDVWYSFIEEKKRHKWIMLGIPMLYGFVEGAIYGACGFYPMFYLMSFLLFAFEISLISDLLWREIPHEANYAIMALALLFVAVGVTPPIYMLLGMLPALILFLVGLVLYLIRPENGFGIGGGDLRLILSTGMLMGISFAVLLMTIGFLVVIVLNLTTLFKNLKTGATTFVPMMSGFTVAFLVMLFGHYAGTYFNSDLLDVLFMFTNI